MRGKLIPKSHDKISSLASICIETLKKVELDLVIEFYLWNFFDDVIWMYADWPQKFNIF
jgi:hypothetical protein